MNTPKQYRPNILLNCFLNLELLYSSSCIVMYCDGLLFPIICLPAASHRFFIDKQRCAASQGPSGKYRTFRPTLTKGGPSPRMRALASQDGLTSRMAATASSVSIWSVGSTGVADVECLASSGIVVLLVRWRPPQTR